MLRSILDNFIAGMEVDVAREINNFLNQEPPPHNRIPGNHASEISSDFYCHRKLFIKDLCTQGGLVVEELNADSFKIFNIGHALHDMVRDYYLGPMGILKGDWQCSRCHKIVNGFMPKTPCGCTQKDLFTDYAPCYALCGSTKISSSIEGNLDQNKIAIRGGCNHCSKWGRWTYKETKIKIPEWNIVGSIDCILEINSEELIVDIKTINSTKFVDIDRVYGSYRQQLTVYMKATGIHKGGVLYICKDTGAFKYFAVEYSEDVFNEIVRENIIERDRVLSGAKLPRMHKRCTSKSFMREHCAFRRYCEGCRKTETVLDKIRELT